MIVEFLKDIIVSIISSTGYLGVFFLMALESACVPIPSEVIVPFSGFLVVSGQFSLMGVVIAGTLGNFAGSLVAYFVGKRYGLSFIKRYGKYILLTESDVERSERFFKKFGNLSVFLGRILPAIRTFISLPAGASKMNLGAFSLWTILGSVPFVWLLGWLGTLLGENWTALEQYFKYIDAFIIIIVVVILSIFIYSKFRSKRHA